MADLITFEIDRVRPHKFLRYATPAFLRFSLGLGVLALVAGLSLFCACVQADEQIPIPPVTANATTTNIVPAPSGPMAPAPTTTATTEKNDPQAAKIEALLDVHLDGVALPGVTPDEMADILQTMLGSDPNFVFDPRIIFLDEEYSPKGLVADPRCIYMHKMINLEVVKDVTVRQVLDMALRPAGLDYLVTDGALFISTTEEIAAFKSRVAAKAALAAIPRATDGKEAPRNAQIAAILDKELPHVDLPGLTVVEACDVLRDMVGPDLTVIVDPLVSAMDVLVRLDVRDVTLRQALNLALHPWGLDYKIADGALFISIAEIIAEGAAQDDIAKEYDAAIARFKERFHIPADQNAATYYLEAYKALPQDRSDDVLEFIPFVARRSAPSALDIAAGAVGKIERYEEATKLLHKGAALYQCAFAVDWDRGSAAVMPHLSATRAVADCALCYGKLLEHEDRQLEAARVYLDVLKMASQVGGDTGDTNLLIGASLLQSTATAIEGLLLRGVDEETATLLLEDISALRLPVFDLPRALNEERVLMGVTSLRSVLPDMRKGKSDLLKMIKEFDELTDALFGQPADNPEEMTTQRQSKTIKWIVPDSPDEIESQFVKALKTSDRIARMLAGAAKRPYPEARHQLRKLSDASAAYWKDEVEKGSFAAWWFGQLDLSAPAFLNEVIADEARVRALGLLSAAALVKARTGAYPEKLDDLRPLVPEAFVMDPFTEAEFSYWLTHDGLPAVQSGIEKGQRKEIGPENYHFSLNYRRTLEEAALRDWQKRAGRETE
jgi:hypothetical protein